MARYENRKPGVEKGDDSSPLTPPPSPEDYFNDPVVGEGPCAVAYSGHRVFPAVGYRYGDSEWGKLTVPPFGNALGKCNRLELARELGVELPRVVVLGSYYRGRSVAFATTLLELCNKQPLINFVGVATDELGDKQARITEKKRVWQYVESKDRESQQCLCEVYGMMTGAEAFSGKVKSEFFRNHLLPRWRPDIILMATFGQRIDEPIIKFPRYGMYNFHPSHLAEGKYPGPNPFFEMLQAKEPTTRMTVHHVDAQFDSGAVVGFSPEINIRAARGVKLTRGEHIIELHKKTSYAAGRMSAHLLKELCQKREPVQALDFEEIFSPDERQAFMEPIQKTDTYYWEFWKEPDHSTGLLS